MRKREGHQSRKYFNQKNKKREREREKWMQEFSSSCERILIHQKTQETWHSMKDHSSWEGWAKLKTHQEKKIQSNWGRWEKVRHISQKKCVQSSQEKWKCIIKDKRVSRSHPGKMEVCQIERKKCSWMKANKIPKKKKKKAC